MSSVTGTIQGSAERVAATTFENGVRQSSSPSKAAVMIQAAARSRTDRSDGFFSGISEDGDGDSDTTTIDYHDDRFVQNTAPCPNGNSRSRDGDTGREGDVGVPPRVLSIARCYPLLPSVNSFK